MRSVVHLTGSSHNKHYTNSYLEQAVGGYHTQATRVLAVVDSLHKNKETRSSHICNKIQKQLEFKQTTVEVQYVCNQYEVNNCSITELTGMGCFTLFTEHSKLATQSKFTVLSKLIQMQLCKISNLYSTQHLYLYTAYH